MAGIILVIIITRTMFFSTPAKEFASNKTFINSHVDLEVSLFNLNPSPANYQAKICELFHSSICQKNNRLKLESKLFSDLRI